MRRAMRARALPTAASSASCVGRTLTIANSAATNTPFATIKARANSKYQVGKGCGWLLYQARRRDDFVKGTPETRVGFGNHLLVGDRDFTARKSSNCKGHRDPVVAVSLDDRRPAPPPGLDAKR